LLEIFAFQLSCALPFLINSTPDAGRCPGLRMDFLNSWREWGECLRRSQSRTALGLSKKRASPPHVTAEEPGAWCWGCP
jgi:hypothetical protein